MDKLDCLRTFLEVTHRGNFTSAAEHLGISKATASNQIVALETAFGANLLARTTKQVGLTEAGEQITELASKLLSDYDEMIDAIAKLHGDATGTLRIGVPPSFGAQYLTPVLLEFLSENPGIEIRVSACNSIDQFASQGFDVAIIVAQSLPDSVHKAFLLSHSPQVLVAAPGYLERCGPIETPQDLKHCNCLINITSAPSAIWRFKGPFGEESVRVRGAFSASWGEMLKQAALLGEGVALHPYYMFAGEIADGRLRIILPDYEPHLTSIHVVYSARELVSRRTQRLLDFLRVWAQLPKDWAGPVR